MLWSLTSRGEEALDGMTIYPNMSSAKMFWLSILASGRIKGDGVGFLCRAAASRIHSTRLFRTIETLQQDALISSTGDAYSLTELGYKTFKLWAWTSAWLCVDEEDITL
jgi:hypothetical protein